MKREEMIATLNERFSRMNDEGIEKMYNFIMIFPEKERWMLTTTPERIAELDALQKQKDLAEAQAKEEELTRLKLEHIQAQEQCRTTNAKLFNAISSVNIPDRYDLGIEDIEVIDFVNGNIKRCFPNYVFSASYAFYKYGFLKGTRYAKAEAKRKAKKKATNCN